MNKTTFKLQYLFNAKFPKTYVEKHQNASNSKKTFEEDFAIGFVGGRCFFEKLIFDSFFISDYKHHVYPRDISCDVSDTVEIKRSHIIGQAKLSAIAHQGTTDILVCVGVSRLAERFGAQFLVQHMVEEFYLFFTIHYGRERRFVVQVERFFSKKISTNGFFHYLYRSLEEQMLVVINVIFESKAWEQAQLIRFGVFLS